jgi:hypothetical protein
VSTSDRELLELAAKAAGIELLDWREDWAYNDSDKGGDAYRTVDRELWNPLRFDDDALRLAVKLAITDLALAVGRYVCSEKHREGDDIYTITRRAIVRAAAAIGAAQ